MLAFFSVWIALAALVTATAMAVYRPVFSDLGVTLVLYFGSPGGLCLAGLVLWAHRKDDSSDAGLQAQRLQCKVAIVMSLLAAAIVYGLIVFATQIEPATAVTIMPV